MYMKKFAERLREARIKFGITSVELARRLSVGSNTVSRWETGTREPDLETISKIADTLNVSAAYLIGSVDIPDKNLLEVMGETDDPSPIPTFIRDALAIATEPQPEVIANTASQTRTPAKIIENLASINGALAETAGLFTDDEVRAAESLLHLCLKNFEAEPGATQKQETAS